MSSLISVKLRTSSVAVAQINPMGWCEVGRLWGRYQVGDGPAGVWRGPLTSIKEAAWAAGCRAIAHVCPCKREKGRGRVESREGDMAAVRIRREKEKKKFHHQCRETCISDKGDATCLPLALSAAKITGFFCMSGYFSTQQILHMVIYGVMTYVHDRNERRTAFTLCTIQRGTDKRRCLCVIVWC